MKYQKIQDAIQAVFYDILHALELNMPKGTAKNERTRYINEKAFAFSYPFLDRIGISKWDILLPIIFAVITSVARFITVQNGMTASSLLLSSSALLIGICLFAMTGWLLNPGWIMRRADVIYWSTVVLGILVIPSDLFVSCGTNVSLFFPIVYGILVSSRKNSGAGGLLYSIFCGTAMTVVCLVTYDIETALISTVVELFLLLQAGRDNWFGIGKRQSIFVISTMIMAMAIPVLCVFPFDFFSKYMFTSLENHSINTQTILSYCEWFGPDPHGLFRFVSKEEVLTRMAMRFGWVALVVFAFCFFGFIGYFAYRCARLKVDSAKAVAISVILTFILRGLNTLLINLGHPLMHRGRFPFMSDHLCVTVLDLFSFGVMIAFIRNSEKICITIEKEDYHDSSC